MILCDRDALSHPSPSPPFAFSHPLVYAFRVQDRVQALDRFLHRELRPKILRLREEHICIEHQLQRTMTKTKKHDSGGLLATSTAKQKQAQRLKHQARLWKRTSKRQELNRFEPFHELAIDLQTLSNELNPNILRLTVMWQRSQSIAPHKRVSAEDSNDVVYDDERIKESGDRRRYWERQRLLREYHNGCMENIRVSKSIQKRIDILTTSEVIASNSTEDSSVLSSLMIFSDNYCVCGTCQAMFHKDYFNALVVRVSNKCETNSHAPHDTSTFLCIHCWMSRVRGQRKERDRETGLGKFGKLPCTKSLPPMPKDGNDDKNRENELQTTPTTKSQNEKNSLFESARWKARKKVIKNRMVAAARVSNEGSSRAGNASATDAITAHEGVDGEVNAATASSTFEHYIGSMPSLDDSLSRLGESLSSFSNTILSESDQEETRHRIPPSLRSVPRPVKSSRTKSVATLKLKMNSSVVVDNNNNAESKTDAKKRIDALSRFGSSASSICSNSIVESDPEGSLHSRRPSASNTTWYGMDDRSWVGKIPIKRGDSWKQYEYSLDSSICSSSIFSESSTETSMNSFLSASSSEPFGPKYIQSAMKKTPASSSSSSTSGASPTKVNDFPFRVSHKKKSVPFRSPLKEYRKFKADNPITGTRSNKALLDTSTDIMDQIDYFCKWDTFMNAFEQKAS